MSIDSDSQIRVKTNSAVYQVKGQTRTNQENVQVCPDLSSRQMSLFDLSDLDVCEDEAAQIARLRAER